MKKKIIFISSAFFIIFCISFAGKCAYSALPTGTGIDTFPVNPRIFVSAATTTGAMGAELLPWRMLILYAILIPTNRLREHIKP